MKIEFTFSKEDFLNLLKQANFFPVAISGKIEVVEFETKGYPLTNISVTVETKEVQ